MVQKPFRVLSIDGGGMRGLYSASVLKVLSDTINDKQNCDVGKAFDLIVGTSTGGILAVGLAYGLTPDEIIDLYIENGPHIFPSPVPKGRMGWIRWLSSRKKMASKGQEALRAALHKKFKNTTIKQLYDDREICLCIPAVRMSTRKAWIFKTGHILKRYGTHSKKRDDNYTLTDVCMATSAAPIILPLKAVDDPNDKNRFDVFADGGLWANNPVLVGLIEALEITESKRNIQIVSVSTASPPSGRVIGKNETDFKLFLGRNNWKAGVGALETSLDAQSSGMQFMASFLAKHLKVEVDIVRLAHDAPSEDQGKYIGLDRADKNAVVALMDMAKSDVENNILGIATKHSEKDIEVLKDIFKNMPAKEV